MLPKTSRVISSKARNLANVSWEKELLGETKGNGAIIRGLHTPSAPLLRSLRSLSGPPSHRALCSPPTGTRIYGCLLVNVIKQMTLIFMHSSARIRANAPEISTRIPFFYRHEIRQLSSRESRKSRRRRVASPALVGFAECLQPDGTHKR